jgi:hypothetical protein
MVARRVVIACAVVMWSPCLCVAQSTPPHSERGFVGVGIGAARDDSVNRDRLASSGSDAPSRIRVWLLEAGVFRARRAAFGVEFIDLGTVQTRSDSACCYSRGAQDESALLGVVRTRVGDAGRLAFDAVGGIGTLFQHRDNTVGLRFPQSESTKTQSARSPAFTVGLDLPVFLSRHIVVTPLFRLYFLRREKVADGFTVTQAPSQRIGVGVSGRATW